MPIDCGTLDRYIDQNLYNGPFQRYFYRALGISPAGCPYRGTSTCTRCHVAPPVICDYKCQIRTAKEKVWRDCEHRAYCKCGHDQTERLLAWGLILL